MSYSPPNAIQIRVAIADIEPAIWRRIVVLRGWRLDQLHHGFRAALNWWNHHLHAFHIGGLRYGDVEIEERGLDDDPRLFDEREVRLRDFALGPPASLVHVVEVEKLLALDTKPKHAACIDGARSRPPEDVGGVSGDRYVTESAIFAERGCAASWCHGRRGAALLTAMGERRGGWS